MADRAFLERLTKDLADQGKLIEAGWVGLRLAAIPDNAPAIQLQAMRLAYMAIIAILDADREPTDADLDRMDLIHKELDAFRAELELWVKKSEGKA